MLEDDTLVFPEIDTEVDIYDADTKFVIILVDGICVKKQSESRVYSRKARVETDSETEDTGSRINSNVVLTIENNGDFEYITEVYDNAREELIHRSDRIKSKIISEYVH